MTSHPRRARAASLLAVAALLWAGQPAAAQAPDSAKASAPPASAPAPASGASVSGVLFLHFQSGGTRAERQLGQQNRFEVDRAYLTVRAPAGEHLSVRATADVFQQKDPARDDFYGGWSYRLKYAYADYAYLRGERGGLEGSARLGMIPTVVIDHEEGYWIRGIAPTAVDREGWFSSADVGASTELALPGMAELFVGAFNGPGYQSREVDRFKDVGARLVLTPFGRREGPALLRSLAVTPWYYKGWTAHPATGGRAGLRRDRYGVHAAARNPNLTLGVQLARRVDQVAAGPVAPGTFGFVEATGELASAYAIVRPLGLVRGGAPGRLLLVARADDVQRDRSNDAAHRFLVGGIGWDLTRRAQLWLDFQGQEARDGSTATDLKTLFARAIVAF